MKGSNVSFEVIFKIEEDSVIAQILTRDE